MLSVYNHYLFYHLNSFFLGPLMGQLEISILIIVKDTSQIKNMGLQLQSKMIVGLLEM